MSVGPKVMTVGLGDVVAGAAKAVGVKPSPGCGCEKRRQALNRATPKIVARLLDGLRGYWSKWCNKGNFPLVVSADPVTVGGNGKKAHEAAG